MGFFRDFDEDDGVYTPPPSTEKVAATIDTVGGVFKTRFTLVNTKTSHEVNVKSIQADIDAWIESTKTGYHFSVGDVSITRTNSIVDSVEFIDCKMRKVFGVKKSFHWECVPVAKFKLSKKD